MTMTLFQSQPGQEGLSFKGLDAPFLRRTVIATLVTLFLVALSARVYFNGGWAMRYFFSGVWTLMFLGLTPLILKAMIFDQNILLAFALIAAKLALIGVMIAVCIWWSGKNANAVGFGSSLTAGVSTPLVVVVLRAIGAQMKSPRGSAHE